MNENFRQNSYNVPAPSHITRSVLVSYVRQNPAMTAEVTPEGLYNHNVCTMMWHNRLRPALCLAQGLVWAIEHCVRWGSGSPPWRGVGFPIVKYRQSAPSRAGASTPYKRWSKCTMEKVGGKRFCRNLGGKGINY